MRWILFGLLLCLANKAVLAFDVSNKEELRFRNLSITEGLSHASVQDVIQDQYGYLWIATRDGLNRYDGNSFQVFKHDPTDSSSLLSSSIMNVIQLKNGELWISTDKGLSKFDYQKEKFENIDSRTGDEPYCRTIVEDSFGNIWVATHSGLLKFDGKLFQYFQADNDDKNSLDHNTVLDLAVWKDKLFVGTLSGLNVFDLKSEVFENANNSTDPIFQTGDYFFKAIAVAPDESVWLGGFDDELGGVVRKYNPKNQQTEIFEPDSADVKALNFNFAILDIFIDDQEQVWIGTNGAGLHRYEEEINGFRKFEPNLKSQLSLNDPDIWSLCQDESGVLWVGTDGGGLFKAHESYGRFVHTKTNPYDNNSLNVNDVHSFEEDENYLWIGTNVGGVNRLDKKSQAFKSYNITEDKTRGLWDYTIYDLEIDSNGKLWIGTNTGGLSVMNPLTERFVHLRHNPDDPSTLSNSVIFAIEEDGRSMWVGTADGLNQVDIQTLGVSRIELNLDEETTPKLINSIARLENQLFVGTGVGLLLKDLNTGKIERISLFPDKNRHVEIHAIESENNRLWIATDFGLVRYKDGEAIWLTKSNGLEDDAVLDIEVDDHGLIWAQGRKHLIKVNPVALQTTVFEIEDNQHNFRSLFLGQNGQMYTGGINGFQSFDPSELEKSSFRPRVYFTSVERLLDGEMKRESLMGKDKIVLGYDQNQFSINFLASDLVEPANNLFAYRINDPDGEWRALGNSSTIPFVDLSHGKYQLEVRASNRDGVWSDKISQLEIVILPPWWMTSWFRILAILLLVNGFFAFHRLRMRSIREQKNKLENQVKERTADLEKSKDLALKDKEIIEQQAEKLAALDKVKSRFFANISHELRTPITLINGPVEAMINGEYGKVDDELLDGLTVVKHNGKSLLSLVNEILDLTKLEAGKLKLNKVPVMLSTFLSDIMDAYRLQADQKQINLMLDFELSENLVLHIDERRVKKIVDNLLSNAIKYTGDGGQINVMAVEYNGGFAVKVKDTGLGIHQDDLVKVFDRFYQSEQPTAKALGGTGIGLALAKELAKLTAGDLTVESEFGVGSEFTYRFEAERMDSDQLDGLQSAVTEDDLHLAMEETAANYSNVFEIDRPKVLLVEDHPIMRMFTKKILEPYFLIEEAPDGAEGLKKLSNGQFDLMVSDVMMPNLDGFELLEKLKGDDDLKNISVIMLTARAEEEDKLFALTMGVDDYMLKPFSPNELLARTKNILQNRIARKDLPAENGNGKELTADQKFLVELKDIVEQNIDSSLLSVSYLAQQVAMSERQLLRRIKNSTGFSPNQFIREVRLQKAKQVLENKQVYTVAEAAYAVGYEKVHYFSTQYAERFGKKPSEELKA